MRFYFVVNASATQKEKSAVEVGYSRIEHNNEKKYRLK